MAFPSPDNFPQDSEPGDQKNSSRSLAIYALITIGLLVLAFYFASQTAGSAPTIESSTIGSASPTAPGLTTRTESPATIASPSVPGLQGAQNQAPETDSLQAMNPLEAVTPTSRPTFTPRPSATPTITPTGTPTPTRTLIPSLTPAFPLTDDSHYRLADWTPELASKLINILQAYPEALSDYARGEYDSGYYAAFQYADLALQESLLRFPSAPAAGEWLWDYTYNLARLGDPRAGVYYAEILTRALNNKTVMLKSLYEWGLQQDPPVTIEIIPLESSPGLLSNNLVKVSAEEHGSAFYWLKESPNGFESYPLTNDFDFLHPTTVNYFVADLTGDGAPEVAIFRSAKPDASAYDFPHIFSLGQGSPVELPFAPAAPPAVGQDFTNHWEPVPPGTGPGDLEFIDTVFPPCPVTVEHYYRWSGRFFEFIEADYQVNPQPVLLSYCSLVVDYSSQVWGTETTIQLMESILPDWPPATNVNGAPFPQDSLDEWRFRLAIYHALLGEQDQASGYANSIIANPAVPGSSWTTPAQDFLNVYQNQRDIYRACLLTSFCDPRQALESLVATLSAGDYPSVLDVLKTSGVSVRSSGYFDFDSNGTTERWIVLRHLPGEPLEFWILAQTGTGVKALFVSTVNENLPHITYLNPDETPPIVIIEPGITFQFETKIPSQEPYLVFVQPERQFSSDLTQKKIEEIQSFLLSGGDPKQASEDLIALNRSTIFTCNFTLCPHYYYLLGLSYELSGEKELAIKSYLKLWRDYAGSPYVTMARLKLSGAAALPEATATASPTGSTTPTLTITGTLPTSTPTPTITPTPSGTLPAPTETATPTGTVPYPYP